MQILLSFSCHQQISQDLTMLCNEIQSLYPSIPIPVSCLARRNCYWLPWGSGLSAESFSLSPSALLLLESGLCSADYFIMSRTWLLILKSFYSESLPIHPNISCTSLCLSLTWGSSIWLCSVRMNILVLSCLCSFWQWLLMRFYTFPWEERISFTCS